MTVPVSFKRSSEVPVDSILWKTGGMKRLILVITALVVASACGSRPTLEPRPGGNPHQTDLSGNWVLRAGDEFSISDEQTFRMPRSAARRDTEMQPSRSKRRSKGSSVHLFLESGKALKVSQTDYGLFFSFDRAVVEEYSFGENRVVSIGPISAQRVSGWDGPGFVVETLDEDGHVLAERWQIVEAVLVRDITIAKGENVSFSKRQVFERE